MVEGKIIKFYRERAGLTLEQLSEGICSVSHLSRVENGTYNSEGIISRLSKRLGICLEDEIEGYQKLHQKLKHLHDDLIMERYLDAEGLKMDIENSPLIQIEDFHVYFQLLCAEYFLAMQHNTNLERIKIANKILEDLEKDEASMSSYYQNMFKHQKGRYLFITGKYLDCISMLKSIDKDSYPHSGYFFILARAYEQVHANTAAYYYAEQARNYFQKILHYKRVNDSELLMLVQLNSKELFDYKETKDRYEQLILAGDSMQDETRKAWLYNELALDHYRRKKYKEAAEYYQIALNIENEQSWGHLYILDGMIRNNFEGNLLTNEKLQALAKKGLKLAKISKSDLWIFFQLYLYQFNQETEEFYQFMEVTALPAAIKHGNKKLIKHYEKKLFHYYCQKDDKQKALEYANSLILG
jgi:HTH-type transcriptional regulator, quorum sensing regulator NprR